MHLSRKIVLRCGVVLAAVVGVLVGAATPALVAVTKEVVVSQVFLGTNATTGQSYYSTCYNLDGSADNWTRSQPITCDSTNKRCSDGTAQQPLRFDLTSDAPLRVHYVVNAGRSEVLVGSDSTANSSGKYTIRQVSGIVHNNIQSFRVEGQNTKGRFSCSVLF